MVNTANKELDTYNDKFQRIATIAMDKMSEIEKLKKDFQQLQGKTDDTNIH